MFGGGKSHTIDAIILELLAFSYSMENLFITYGDLLIKLALAMILGFILGLERTLAGKQAGMRTYALVTMGSCLFILISESMRQALGGAPGFDPMRMATQVVVGIGFIGAGLIIFQENNIHGLTTAAGLWVSAGVGMAVGFGLYMLASLAALLTLFIFSVLWRVERYISPETAQKR